MEYCFNLLKLLAGTTLVATLINCGGDPIPTANSGGNTNNTTAGGTPVSNNTVANSTPTISFDSASNTQLELRGQGGVETTIVTFTLSNVSGDAIAGTAVDFELSNNIGGLSFLGDDSATSDANGLVSAIVQGGVFPTSFSVTATIVGTNTRAVSNEIAVSSSTFSARSFPLTGIVNDDIKPGLNSLLVDSAKDLAGIEVELQLITTDQFGHKVFDGSRITIVSPETGLVEPSTCELQGGICKSTWISTQPGLSDEVVTIIAYASGAESFDDLNGNNIYEVGEEFIDLGEAYADTNENGAYDMGEFFVDANGDNIFNAEGNGVWDGPCVSILGESETDKQARCAGEQSTIISDQLLLTLLPIPEDGAPAN